MMPVHRGLLLIVAMSGLLQGGRISGHVSLSVEVSKPAVMLSPYSRNRYRPPAERRADNDLSNIVIYIKSHNNLLPSANAATAVVDQRNITLLPHVTVTEVGRPVKFLNSDAVYHNIFSLSKLSRFNLGRFPRGQSRQVIFDQVGTVEVFCDIHSDMSAVIIVVPNAFFAIPDADGNYMIDELPVGSYTVVAWRENHPEQIMHIDIKSPVDTVIINFAM